MKKADNCNFWAMNIKLNLRFVLVTLIFSVLLCGYKCHAQSVSALRTIVIDAGHGGVDPGAVSGNIYEKDINFKIALELERMLKEGLPDVKVIQTRRTDVKVNLYERGNIANRANADLFVSIHVNASEKPSANGHSTYVLGVDKSKQNLQEVMRENSVITYEEDYQSRYEGFDPTSPESYIIFSLMQNVYLDKSMELAELVQQRYAANIPGMRNRGTYQAGFLVLWKTAMPSILTEIGFISNAEDRNYMIKESSIQTYARSLYEAICLYKNNIENRAIASQIAQPEPTPVPSVEPVVTDNNGVCFYVQLLTSRSPLKSVADKLTPYADKVVERKAGAWYKYLLGGYVTVAEARKAQTEAKQNNFKDAFIVAYDGDEQISLAEAARRINENNTAKK